MTHSQFFYYCAHRPATLKGWLSFFFFFKSWASHLSRCNWYLRDCTKQLSLSLMSLFSGPFVFFVVLFPCSQKCMNFVFLCPSLGNFPSTLLFPQEFLLFHILRPRRIRMSWETEWMGYVVVGRGGVLEIPIGNLHSTNIRSTPFTWLLHPFTMSTRSWDLDLPIASWLWGRGLNFFNSVISSGSLCESVVAEDNVLSGRGRDGKKRTKRDKIRITTFGLNLRRPERNFAATITPSCVVLAVLHTSLLMGEFTTYVK